MTLIEITEDHRKQLARLLDGDDDASVLVAASQAAHLWGFAPQSDEPTDEEWSAAESATMFLVEVIRSGLADGSITPSAPKADAELPKPKTDAEKEDAEILAKLGL